MWDFRSVFYCISDPEPQILKCYSLFFHSVAIKCHLVDSMGGQHSAVYRVWKKQTCTDNIPRESDGGIRHVHRWNYDTSASVGCRIRIRDAEGISSGSICCMDVRCLHLPFC